MRCSLAEQFCHNPVPSGTRKLIFFERQDIKNKITYLWKSQELPSRHPGLCWFNVATSFVRRSTPESGHQTHCMLFYPRNFLELSTLAALDFPGKLPIEWDELLRGSPWAPEQLPREGCFLRASSMLSFQPLAGTLVQEKLQLNGT